MWCNKIDMCSAIKTDKIKSLLLEGKISMCETKTFERYCKNNSVKCPYNPDNPSFSPVLKEYFDEIYRELKI